MEQMQLDILLVNPPLCSDASGKPTAPENIGLTCGVMPPIQLVKLATMLRRNGHSVKVLDLAILASKNNILQLFQELLSRIHVRYVGFSNHSVINLGAIEKLASIAKNRGAIVLIGGINPTHMQGEIFQYVPSADVVFVGFAEKTLMDYVQNKTISKGVITKQTAIVPQNLRDLAQHNADVNSALSTLDNAGALDLSLLLFLKEYVKAGCIYPIETQRGCEFSCNFCVSKMLLGSAPARRKLESVLEELELAIAFGFSEFFFTDNTFTGNREYAEKLCKAMIELKTKKKTKNILCMTRVDAVDAELLQLMASAGFTGIGFGVETVGEVQLLGKGLNRQKNLEKTKGIFSQARALGIEPTAFLMVGSPFDTEQTLTATLAFFKKAFSEGWLREGFVTISKFIPVPGSIYYYYSEKFGIEKFTKEKFQNAWFFSGPAVTSTRNLSLDKVSEWHSRFKRELQVGVPLFELVG